MDWIISLVISYSIVFNVQMFELCRIQHYNKIGAVFMFADSLYSRNFTRLCLKRDHEFLKMSQKELFLFGMTLSGEDREKFEFIFKYKLEPNLFKKCAMIVKDTHRELMISMFKINKY